MKMIQLVQYGNVDMYDYAIAPSGTFIKGDRFIIGTKVHRVEKAMSLVVGSDTQVFFEDILGVSLFDLPRIREKILCTVEYDWEGDDDIET